MARFKDLTGRRFGRLLVLSHAVNDKQNKAQWNCRCDCGNEKVVRASTLKRGHALSCGCFQREMLSKRKWEHGHTANGTTSKTYKAWMLMKGRCFDRNNDSFKSYGGRGITVCERWLTFENFLADMGIKPPGHTLERINNNRNYEPGNCRWATPREQANNRRNTVRLKFQNKTMTVSEWAQEVGLNRDLIALRLYYGWTVSRALTQPVGRYRKSS